MIQKSWPLKTLRALRKQAKKSSVKAIRLPPKPQLTLKQAREKAYCEGRYSNLLKRIRLRSEYTTVKDLHIDFSVGGFFDEFRKAIHCRGIRVAIVVDVPRTPIRRCGCAAEDEKGGGCDQQLRRDHFEHVLLLRCCDKD